MLFYFGSDIMLLAAAPYICSLYCSLRFPRFVLNILHTGTVRNDPDYVETVIIVLKTSVEKENMAHSSDYP